MNVMAGLAGRLPADARNKGRAVSRVVGCILQGTGAYAGHSAVCFKDSDGKLWVAKSGHENEKGESIIVVLPWEEWWNIELNKDDSNPQIALFPLHPDIRAKFNETAAWGFARSMEGKSYGYHNMIFSWIDISKDNYPPPLDAHMNRVQSDYAANLRNEALNKRLGTESFMCPSGINDFPMTNCQIQPISRLKLKLMVSQMNSGSASELMNQKLQAQQVSVHELIRRLVVLISK
ncbi:hypothetical protein J5N97_024891 [Dioscorea zingiberensis]|uniref:Uncharacterized protein n=1 Tax=Dioscorea zingiberensis TaxID=325984 RepID=A0A9D5C7R4_9LILI|nr:hypothetical protein J5N97_024891 [Dioscorea zingiberensis]